MVGVRRYQIEVKYIETYSEMNEDGEFKCPHYNATVEKPCCTGGRIIDCGCQGMYSVDCPDCDNEDLTDQDVENIIDNYTDRGEE